MSTDKQQHLEAEFAKAQVELMDSFKNKLHTAAKDVLGTMYADIANYATTDAHMNYHNFLRDEFRDSLLKEIAYEGGHYSWAHSIRMTLLEKHVAVLQCKIISDLESKVKSLEQQIEDMQRFL